MAKAALHHVHADFSAVDSALALERTPSAPCKLMQESRLVFYAILGREARTDAPIRIHGTTRAVGFCAMVTPF
jgi:hypothetical protein